MTLRRQLCECPAGEQGTMAGRTRSPDSACILEAGNLDTRRADHIPRSVGAFMNIGLFGGTFDPVHRGHMALARAALEQYKLNRVYFVPANIPPHKQRQPLSPFVHRFAMLALATAQEKAFVPSLLEAPEEGAAPVRSNARSNKDGQEKPNYTIDTIRRLKQSFKASDKLFLLIGMDAFADIAKWHQAEAAVSRVRVRRGQPPGIFAGRCGERSAREPASAAGSDAAVSEAGGHRGSGAEGSNHPPAGGSASTGLGDSDPPGRGRGQTAGPVRGCSGGGVHQEDGTV